MSHKRAIKVHEKFDVFILAKANGTRQTLKLSTAMYLSCDVTGLTDDVKVERYWTKDGVAIKQVDTKRRMHYFPDAKTLQITQTGRFVKVYPM